MLKDDPSHRSLVSGAHIVSVRFDRFEGIDINPVLGLAASLPAMDVNRFVPLVRVEKEPSPENHQDRRHPHTPSAVSMLPRLECRASREAPSPRPHSGRGPGARQARLETRARTGEHFGKDRLDQRSEGMACPDAMPVRRWIPGCVAGRDGRGPSWPDPLRAKRDATIGSPRRKSSCRSRPLPLAGESSLRRGYNRSA